MAHAVKEMYPQTKLAIGPSIADGFYYDLDCDHTITEEDLPKIEELHQKVMKFSSTIYKVGRYESSYLKGLKCALSCVGICSDFMAEPFHRFRQEEHERIEQYVKELGIKPKK